MWEEAEKEKKWRKMIFNKCVLPWNLPFGMPHGPFVRELSKKSKSYFRAGGYVNATWPLINVIQLDAIKTNVNNKHLKSFILYILINDYFDCFEVVFYFFFSNT